LRSLSVSGRPVNGGARDRPRGEPQVNTGEALDGSGSREVSIEPVGRGTHTAKVLPLAKIVSLRTHSGRYHQMVDCPERDRLMNMREQA
jgi:hypothetical protein